MNIRTNTLRCGRHAICRSQAVIVLCVCCQSEINFVLGLCVALSLTIPPGRFCRRAILFAIKGVFCFGDETKITLNKVDKANLWILRETNRSRDTQIPSDMGIPFSSVCLFPCFFLIQGRQIHRRLKGKENL